MNHLSDRPRPVPPAESAALPAGLQLVERVEDALAPALAELRGVVPGLRPTRRFDDGGWMLGLARRRGGPSAARVDVTRAEFRVRVLDAAQSRIEITVRRTVVGRDLSSARWAGAFDAAGARAALAWAEERLLEFASSWFGDGARAG